MVGEAAVDFRDFVVSRNSSRKAGMFREALDSFCSLALKISEVRH